MSVFETAKREILEWVSATIHVPIDEIDLTKPLPDIGIDSLDAVHMIATIEALIKQELPDNVIQQVSSLHDIFELMRERLAAA